jgi:hypothetical protein
MVTSSPAFGFLADIGFEAKNIMMIMSIGQVAEIVTMAALGLVLAKLGWRTTMILGILGHRCPLRGVRVHAA